MDDSPDNDRNKSYETVQSYVTALEIPTALVELRKRGNPPIILRDKISNCCWRKLPSQLFKYKVLLLFYDSKKWVA